MVQRELRPKSLGMIAYDAYTEEHEVRIPWKDLPEGTMDDWEHVGRRVMEAVTDSVLREMMEELG